MTDRFHFTKKALTSLPIPAPRPGGETVRSYHYDTKVNGLLLSVSDRDVRSFMVRRKVGGKSVRVTLGRFPDMTIEQARRKAQAALSDLAEGVNPNTVKRARKVRRVTLGDVFGDYLNARKALKPGTIQDYRRIMRQAFPDWQDKPLGNITRDMVTNRHHQLGARSPARANNAMRVLRALFNFAAGEYEDEAGQPLFPDNPVTRIAHTKAWYRVERRRSVILTHELRPWLDAVLSLASEHPGEQAETARDYLLALLLSGLRREEAARLQWPHVDLQARTLTILDTKNHEPHTLPLSDYLHGLLSRRRQELPPDSPYVFPSAASKTGHIVNVYKQVARVRERSGVSFTLHDLRRTFITVAEGLDISAYAVKRLANHKLGHDVTAGYIVTDVERLRRPMQQITDFILTTGGLKAGADVLPMRTGAAGSPQT